MKCGDGRRRAVRLTDIAQEISRAVRAGEAYCAHAGERGIAGRAALAREDEVGIEPRALGDSAGEREPAERALIGEVP